MGCGMSRYPPNYPLDDNPHYQGAVYHQGAPLQPLEPRRGPGRGCPHRRGPPGPCGRRRGCHRGPPWAGPRGGYTQPGMAPQGGASAGPRFEEYRDSSMETKVEKPMKDEGLEGYKDEVDESGPPRYSKISAA